MPPNHNSSRQDLTFPWEGSAAITVQSEELLFMANTILLKCQSSTDNQLVNSLGNNGSENCPFTVTFSVDSSREKQKLFLLCHRPASVYLLIDLFMPPCPGDFIKTFC